MRPPALQIMPEPCERASRLVATSLGPLKICTVERLRRSAISPNPRMSVAPGTLRNGDCDLPRFAAAKQVDRHALTDGVAFQRALDVVRILHGLAAELDYDIADQYAGLGGGSGGFQR